MEVPFSPIESFERLSHLARPGSYFFFDLQGTLLYEKEMRWQLTDPFLPLLWETWKAKGAKLFALTAANRARAPSLLSLLEAEGITFDKTDYPFSYEGALMTEGMSKGERLWDFFQFEGLENPSFLMVDDLAFQLYDIAERFKRPPPQLFHYQCPRR